MIDLFTPLVNFLIVRQARRDEKKWQRRRRQAEAEWPERLTQWELGASQARERAGQPTSTHITKPSLGTGSDRATRLRARPQRHDL